MVPGVAAEQHALAGLDDPDLPMLWVRDDQSAGENPVEHVGGEDCLVRRAVPAAAWCVALNTCSADVET